MDRKIEVSADYMRAISRLHFANFLNSGKKESLEMYKKSAREYASLVPDIKVTEFFVAGYK